MISKKKNACYFTNYQLNSHQTVTTLPDMQSFKVNDVDEGCTKFSFEPWIYTGLHVSVLYYFIIMYLLNGLLKMTTAY